jgi:4-amino-4-deoxy-L-arabinose transferase-like glycosyltransferase
MPPRPGRQGSDDLVESATSAGIESATGAAPTRPLSRPESGIRRLVLSRWGLLVALSGLGGIALRVWWYRSRLGTPNSDESVVGLMVLHALHGHFSTFFWGSPYGGPQEVWLTVPVFAVAGVNYYALRSVPILLTALTSFVIWRVGRRTIGEPAALVAGALFWVWPPFNIFQLSQQQSFYAPEVLYCSLLLLLGLRVVERPDRVRVGIFGLVLGLAFWETPQIVPIAVPLILWVAWRAPRGLRNAWVGVLGALLGALPWLIWNSRHGWASLTVHHSLSAFQHSLRLLASPVLPMTVGLRAPFGQEPLLAPAFLTDLLYLVLILLFFFGWYRARGRDRMLLYVVAAVFPFLYAIDRRTSFLSSWPQYTVVVTPVVTLLIAQLGSRYWRAVLVVAAGFAISAVSMPRMADWFKIPQPVPYAPRSVAPLIATLDRLGIDRVYADYWIAYRLDFATQERIIAAENTFSSVHYRGGQAIASPDPSSRHRAYERQVAAAPDHGFVFFRRTYRSLPIIPSLTAHGYKRYPVGSLVVYAKPRPG